MLEAVFATACYTTIEIDEVYRVTARGKLRDLQEEYPAQLSDRVLVAIIRGCPRTLDWWVNPVWCIVSKIMARLSTYMQHATCCL